MSRIQISPHCQLSPDWILKIIPYFEALGSRSSLIELLIIKSYGLTTIGSSSLNAAQLHSIERRPGVRQQRSTRPAKKRAGITVAFENSTVIAKPHDLSILGVGAKEGMPLLYRALYRPRNATLILLQCRQIETLPRKCYAHTSSLLKFGPKLQLKKKSTVGNRHRRVFFGGDIVKFDCDACQCARAQIPAKQALKSSILRLRKQQLMVRLEGMRKRCCEKN